MGMAWNLDPYRCFAPEPTQRDLAAQFHAAVKELPLVCPHGHVDPALLLSAKRFASPAELLVRPDHYILRMLYSQGVSLENLGLPPRDGTPYEEDGRKVWQLFCDHFHLFAATPTGLWLKEELIGVFGISEKPNSANAQAIYDHLEARLAKPEYSPKALFRRFNIEVLCTTDDATDTLVAHRRLQQEGFAVRPTFRPDRLLDLHSPDWPAHLRKLSEVSGIAVSDFPSFLRALWQRRAYFQANGATATDHGALYPHIERLSPPAVEALFTKALRGQAEVSDTAQFTAHMLLELAHRSAEDGLVMQLHVGSIRNHNASLFQRFGPDVGADLPVAVNWTESLKPLLDELGNHPKLRLLLFTLDESTYSRELAPLAGHYPVLWLGPPWWFFDSVKGMERYLDSVVETAGFYNLAGFNDDTRAFASIPARHEVWRRVSCNWLAAQVVQGLMDIEDAQQAARQLAYELTKSTYRLEQAYPVAQPKLS